MTAPGRPASVDPAEFRSLMARWATGVSVVTARDGPVDAGLTVNAFLSVSLSPPSVLVSLTEDADTTPVIERTGLFAVNFLAADQRPLSERFALPSPPSEKFADLAVHRGKTGVPLLDGTLAALECRMVSRLPAYDHILFLGEVVHQELGRDAPPLLYFRSDYAALGPAGRGNPGKPAKPGASRL
jgi:3-hydroxy-9,10-secoandrosta-1,3,5(10)-triene-9,17-dione monooxygenase reductase component